MKLEIIDENNYNNYCGKMRSCFFVLLMLFLELASKKCSVHGFVLNKKEREKQQHKNDEAE